MKGYNLTDALLQVNKEQELGLTKSRKKFDIREEYFVSYFSTRGISLPSFDLILNSWDLTEIELGSRARLGA